MSILYPCVYCTEDGYCEKFSDKEVTSWCVQSPCKDEKPSNADRIRSMTDEELSNYIWQLQNTKERRSTNGWLDWLKKEVDDAEQLQNDH